MKLFIFVFGILSLISCASGVKSDKKIVETSGEKPDWVGKAKIAWEADGKVFFKLTSQRRGDERVNACFDSAKLEGSHTVASEIQHEIKSAIDSAETSMNENAETVFSKSISQVTGGNINGLRFSEQYYERVSVDDTIRINCYLLGEIKNSDYNKVKRSIIDKVQAADPRLKEAIAAKQINFFSSADRAPASSSEGQ